MSLPNFYIHLDRSGTKTLSRQVYEKIRDDILLKKILPGTRLPATRLLAHELAISRNVVMDAYDQLQAEGYVQSRAGACTRVCEDTHYRAYSKPKTETPPPGDQKHPADISFKTGLPDLSCFPRDRWGKYLKVAVDRAKQSDLAYSDPAGHEGFRQVLAEYLYRSRGIQVLPDQIVITSGATQALFLTARVLFKPGCEAVIEDPGGYGVLKILATAGFRFSPLKNDGQGPDISGLRPGSHTRLVYVTPSHQFPMGNIMPAATRIKLLNALTGNPMYIVEDDYDSEFRYDGPPIYPLKALDPERVIYIGSFSKALSPALRIGYVVVPEALLETFKEIKWFSNAQSPIIEQIALERFIRDGGFERHVFRMKKVYTKKRDVLIDSLYKAFGPDVSIFGENAGLHLVARFRGRTFDPDDRGNVCFNGVMIQSVEKHTIIKGRHTDKLVFGYGNLSVEQITRGVRQLDRFN